MPIASYATVAELREYLPQIKSEALEPGTDAKLQKILDRATGICNDASVGLGFAFAGYVTEVRSVISYGSPYLVLPPHREGSITSIKLDSVAITDYAIDPDGTLRRTVGSQWRRIEREDWGWRGFRYDIAADWGYGTAPDSVKEVCIEIAVNIWRARDAGRFTNVVGPSDAGAVGYEGALTPLQRSVLQGVKQIYTRGVVSV